MFNFFLVSLYIMVFTRRKTRTTRRAQRVKRGKMARRRFAKKRNTKFKTLVPMGIGFPQKVIVTHRYTTAMTAQAPLGVFTNHRWSCNSLFDPDTTGAGHKPLYYNEYAALYNHYTVIGSKITVNAVPYNTIEPGVVGMYINDDNVNDYTSAQTALEQSKRNFSFLGASAGQTPKRFSLKWSAKKQFGAAVMANDKLTGSDTTSPLEQSYYNFWLAELTASANYNVELIVNIEYIAIWTELKQVASS